MTTPTLSSFIVPHFPKPGVAFYDITPILANPESREIYLKYFESQVPKQTTHVVALESRGFPLGAMLADRLSLGFVMARKPGKTPNPATIRYQTEYSEDQLEIAKDALDSSSNVVIFDDILATGGTACAAVQLVKQLGASVVSTLFMGVIIGLGGVDRLACHTLPICPFQALTVPTMEPLPKRYFSTRALPPLTSRKTIVMCHPVSRELADEMLQSSDDLEYKHIEFESFPDKYENIRFEQNDELSVLRGRKVIYLFSMLNQRDVMSQMQLLTVLPRQNVQSLEIIIPYFAPATMERVTEEGVVATAETYAKLISSVCESTLSGSPIIRIFDLHAQTVRMFFDHQRARVVPMSMMPTLAAHLRVSYDNLIVVFPDEGARKRFAVNFKHFRYVTCSKRRIGERREITLAETFNFNMEHPSFEISKHQWVIVDDLVQTGGTLIQTKNMLRTMGAQYVAAAVVHPVFPKNSYRRLIDESDPFNRFWVTNTTAMADEVVQCKAELFHKISIVPKLLHDLQLSSHAGYLTEVYVGSQNKDKLDAVRSLINQSNGYKMVGGGTKIYGVVTNSGVPNQPIGEEQILKGAENRWNALRQNQHINKEKSLLVAVESGIVGDETNGYHEATGVYLGTKVPNGRYKKGSFVKRLDEPLETDLVEQIKAAKQEQTYGELYQQKYHCNTDWYPTAFGFTRSEAIAKVLREFVSFGGWKPFWEE